MPTACSTLAMVFGFRGLSVGRPGMRTFLSSRPRACRHAAGQSPGGGPTRSYTRGLGGLALYFAFSAAS